MKPPWEDDLNIQMLVKLLRMTESSHDGEALNAIRMANSMLNRHNANWDDVMRAKVPMVDADPFAAAPNLGTSKAPHYGYASSSTPGGSGGGSPKHTDATEIEQYFALLTQRDLGTFKDYVDDVYRWWQDKGFLTDKQYHVIKNASQRRPRRAP